MEDLVRMERRTAKTRTTNAVVAAIPIGVALVITVIVLAWTVANGQQLRVGDWVQHEPSRCATRCGVAAGQSGTPGAVLCPTSNCDPHPKPDPKQCGKTGDCSTTATTTPTT